MSSYYNKPNNGNFIPIPKGPHNERVRKSAEGHAYQMKVHPSWLEKQMIELLDSWKVKYEFQKIIYIKSSGGFIKQYYIADFFLPFFPRRISLLKLMANSTRNKRLLTSSGPKKSRSITLR